MAFIAGRTHAVFPIADASRVGEARRHAASLAARCGFDETLAGRLAIVVTELGTNLFRHAQDGRMLLAASGDEVEVIAIDRGPGIADVRRSVADGFSTGGTPGTGLGAVKRLSTDFDLHSVPGEGTLIVARLRVGAKPPAHDEPLCIAGIATCAPGEFVCGDSWAARTEGDRATVILADGLGHGEAAAEASRDAVEVFRTGLPASPRSLLEQAHVALRTTRGAAVAIFHADRAAGKFNYAGAGNVVSRAVSGTSDRTLLTQHGTAGLQMRRPEEATADWPPHAVLVMHSDGIEARWTPQRIVPLLGRDPALIAAVLMRDHCRGRDDATVVVVAARK
ncbi:ATP-binding protein [Ramlibacter sp. PS4R-6]|uniref:ATP-binding protein n=1 Tax=Ramlibacter sp. PS4R-6 TaxID=3133438 RepID=UPI0030A6B506